MLAPCVSASTRRVGTPRAASTAASVTARVVRPGDPSGPQTATTIPGRSSRRSPAASPLVPAGPPRGSLPRSAFATPEASSVGGKPGYAGPELLVERVIVAAVPESGAVLGGSSARRAVHLVIPEDKVKTLVADMDLESRITLVPAPGGVRREGS